MSKYILLYQNQTIDKSKQLQLLRETKMYVFLKFNENTIVRVNIKTLKTKYFVLQPKKYAYESTKALMLIKV